MDLLTATFSGHESFPLRTTWLTKGLQACEQDPLVFGRNDAMVTLGVGKNMVRSIRHWCLATGMLEEDPLTKDRGRTLRPTEIGRHLFLADPAWDPYLEDMGTLWLVHWLLVTNEAKATTWHFVFNLFPQPEFTRAGVEHAIAERAARSSNVRCTAGTLRRDVAVFIRTYVGSTGPAGQVLEESMECPLVELGLIYEQSQPGAYAFARGPKDTLPDAVFAYAVWDYARQREAQRSLTFDELAYGPLGVGRVFKMDEASLAERLDRLAELTSGAWQFSETAGYKQLIRRSDIYPMTLLSDYYHPDSRRPVDA